jgi:hypothetical protein
MEAELHVALNLARACAMRLLKPWYLSGVFWLVLVFCSF